MRGKAVARDVDHWLSRLEPRQRAALEKLRAQTKAAAPGAEEVISYGQPTFKLHGHLVAFGAFKNHLSFFPMSSTLIRQIPEAAPFATSSGTLQFQPDKPIPAALVKTLVKARVAQNLEIADERAQRKKAPRRKPVARKAPKPKAAR
ncbi:MAG TPA: DUF1801 domain-containing protein [Hyphomonadaceae bacterium]|nr:DUF1801 domain-containing protein [Hyphomonadaceae bacterium]